MQARTVDRETRKWVSRLAAGDANIALPLGEHYILLGQAIDTLHQACPHPRCAVYSFQHRFEQIDSLLGRWRVLNDCAPDLVRPPKHRKEIGLGGLRNTVTIWPRQLLVGLIVLVRLALVQNEDDGGTYEEVTGGKCQPSSRLLGGVWTILGCYGCQEPRVLPKNSPWQGR